MLIKIIEIKNITVMIKLIIFKYYMDQIEFIKITKYQVHHIE